MIFKNQDEKIKKRSTLEDADAFWDVSEITPPKTERRSYSNSDVEAVIVVDKGDAKEERRSQPIEKPKETSELLFEYCTDNVLLKKISVYTWPTKYTFYERFAVDARKYFNVKGKEVQPVKYFSYMPSYMQMSLRQREWYFYWRDRVRNKEYLTADSSYILLYLYEIINLGDIIKAQEGLELLCDIWENYRTVYTKLDKFLTEWVCDYCLVNKLEPPLERIASFYDGAVDDASFKQFYIDCKNSDGYAYLLCEKLSSYKWRKSKYITDGNSKVFEKHIKSGFAYAVKRLAVSDGRFDAESGRLVEKNILRDAFSGSLCSYRAKRKISIDYFDIENVNDLGFIVTDMVRYCENRVRAYLGIKARLSVQNLTEEQKAFINEYFDKYLPCVFFEKKKKRKDEEDQTYAEEIKPFEVSFEKAKEIEKNSWQITERLVDELYEDEEVEEQKKTEIPSSLESEALDIAKSALTCIARNDNEGFLKLAEESYMLPETLAECVNELCFEILGDIGIEERTEGYVLISDYEQEIKEWLKR